MTDELYNRILHGLREGETANQQQLIKSIYDECVKDCATCGEGSECPLGECENSKRACGHHCNCIWTQDSCCWCGYELSEEGAD